MIGQQLYPPPLKDTDFTVSAAAALGLWRGQRVLLYTTSQKRIKQLKSSIARCLMMLVRIYLLRGLTGSEKRELMRICEENIEFVIPQYLNEYCSQRMITLVDSLICKPEQYLMGRILNTSTKQQ